jgi:hypothetical protein
MASKALDLTTVGHALSELCDAFLGEAEWNGINDQQQEFLTWWALHRDEIRKLSSLEALASTDYAELNKFLLARGFDAMFERFEGIGVAAILDMLVEWAVTGTPTSISRYEGSGGVGYLLMQTATDYPAFKISAGGADVYAAAGYAHPLIRLHTKTGHHLWLMKADEPASGLELNRQAQHLANLTGLRPSLRWTAGVIIPMLEMDIKPDVSWMLHATAVSPAHGKYAVEQVFQRFKLRANDKGARVKVVTGMVAMAACAGPPPPTPYHLDDPFIGFFTQPGNPTLPLAAFWADTDVWRNPEGTLEEL